MAPSVAKCGRTSAAADVDEHQGDELAAFNPHRDVDLMAVYRASLAAAAGVDEPGA